MGSKNYDNWERLVGAVLRREQFRQMALSHSRNSSINGSESSSSFSFSFNEEDDYLSFDNKLSEVPEVYDVGNWGRILARGNLRLFPIPEISRRKLPMVGPSKLGQWVATWTADNISNSDFKAVELNSVFLLDIRGRMDIKMLAINTIYGAYLVFKLASRFSGLESVQAMIRFVNYESDKDAENRAQIVHLQPMNINSRNESNPVRREDKWIEVQIGSFYINHFDETEEVEARLLETRQWKTGLTVKGIDFRPLYVLKKSNLRYPSGSTNTVGMSVSRQRQILSTRTLLQCCMQPVGMSVSRQRQILSTRTLLQCCMQPGI